MLLGDVAVDELEPGAEVQRQAIYRPLLLRIQRALHDAVLVFVRRCPVRNRLRHSSGECVADVVVDEEIVVERGATQLQTALQVMRAGDVGRRCADIQRRKILEAACDALAQRLAWRAVPVVAHPVEHGNVVHTAALHIGGRLAVFDEHGRLTRLDPAGQRLATLAGLNWKLGATVTDEQIERVTDWMADALVAALTECTPTSDVQSLWLTEPLGVVGGVAGAMVSGGVGEYVYERETRDFRLLLPSLDGVATYGYTNIYAVNGPYQLGWTGTLSVTLPIVDHLVTYSAYRTQSYVRQRSEFTLEQVERDARAEVESATAAFTRSYASAKNRDRTLKIARDPTDPPLGSAFADAEERRRSSIPRSLRRSSLNSRRSTPSMR